MSSQEKLSPEEIGQRITAGMGLVYDLFKEMNSFFRLVSQGLRDADADIRVIPMKGFLLPRQKMGRAIAELYVRTDMGLLAEIGGTTPAENEEDFDTTDDAEDADVETDSTTESITPDTRYLAVRAALYDANVAAEKFTPSVVAAVLGSFKRTPVGKKAKESGGGKPQASFPLKRTPLKRLAKNLPLDLACGQTVSARIIKAQLTAEAIGVEIVRLGEIDSEESVAKFVGRMIEMCENS